MPHATKAQIIFVVGALWCAGAQRVAVVSSGPDGGPANHGLRKLEESLVARGFEVVTDPAQADQVVVAGVASDRMPPQGLRVRKIRRQGKPGLELQGADSRGLMYAALDVAARVNWAPAGADPFSEVRDVTEAPYLLERGISIYTMHRAYFESRLHDAGHWRRYFDLLAASRINALTVIFGYENGGFMAPAYPYFFDLPEFPSVRLIGITSRQQAKNAEAFRAMIRIAHERGIEVIPAIWDHIYRGGVQGGGIPGASDLAGKDTPGLVSGVTTENLSAYTRAALKRFLEVFPEVDGIEFRMHNESGLKREEMAGFWHEVFAMLAKFKPGMRVTLRAKELPDEIIEDALNQGLAARIETKYWMEQMGLPFHPTHVNRQNQKERRHGYADLLKYPQKYKVHWRLWNGGTTRLLLWADPDYVRRFAESARLYGGNSFDVNEMLATKMLGEPHDRPPMPIHTQDYRFYDHEFERYWHFYQLWGRLTYNPSTPPEVWEREFTRRFGKAGTPLMQGLHEAGKVLPRIVASSYRYQLFPTTRGWAEMMRQGDLPEFAGLEGSDIEQFMSPREAATRPAPDLSAARRTPAETATWFARTAESLTGHLNQAAAAGMSGKEAITIAADLRILAGLAKFYAARLPAAVAYNAYREKSEPSALRLAIEQERAAIAAWRGIVEAAGGVYSTDLAFGVHRVGFPRHWSEELGRLEAGLKKLQSLPEPPIEARAGEPARTEFHPPAVVIDRPRSATPGHDLTVTAKAPDPARIATMKLRYRRLTQLEDYQVAEMQFDKATGKHSARIPGAFITPQWDVMFFVEAIDTLGNGRNYPDLEIETPYVVVPVERADATPAIRVASDFEGGNIRSFEQPAPGRIVVSLPGETDQDGRNRQANWYYFRLDGVRNQPLTIDITNLAGEYNYKPNKGAVTADTPPFFSADNNAWQPWRDFTYDPATPRLTLRITPETDTLWIAHTPPYTNVHLDRLRRDIRAHPAFRESVIGRTPQGRSLLHWTITEPAVTEPKKVIWLMARQHSWESGTSWVAEGLIRFLLSTDPQAAAIRRGAIVHILPMCDPDGVARGGVRFNHKGYDLNRNWDLFNPGSMPEIAAQHAAIAKWLKQGNPIHLFLTLHNTETAEYLDGPPAPASSPIRALGDKLFRLLEQQHGFAPSRPLAWAEPTTTAGKPGRMTVVQGLYRDFTLPAFLMELRVSRHPELNRQPNIDDRLAFGRRLAESLWLALQP